MASIVEVDGVLQTCVVCFNQVNEQEEETPEEWLCIRMRTFLTLSRAGAMVHVPLPFPVRNTIPISEGVLIERDTNREEPGLSYLPTIFSLSSSTHDICPTTTHKAGVCCYYGDSSLVIGSFEQDRSLVLIFNPISQIHSIWRVRPASAEDIPMTTLKRSLNSSITITPRSTSAPSHYDLQQKTPFTKIDNTPTPMVLTANKRLLKAYRATPHHSGTGGGSGKGIGKFGSGRSPFVSRQHHPTPLGVTGGQKKRSKSMSPSHHAAGRLSPFSQTLHSNSWSTFFSEETAVSLDPLLPQICMDKVYDMSERTLKPATKFFTCGSLIEPNRVHYYLLIPSSSELWMLSAEVDTVASSPTVTRLPAVQAIPVQDQNMVLVLSPTGVLSLHSGTLKVCSIGTEWLLANSEPDESETCEDGNDQNMEEYRNDNNMEHGDKVVSIKERERSELGVLLDSGAILSFILPPLYSSHSEECLLAAMAETLPTVVAHNMLADHYRACVEMSPKPFTLHYFLQWLLSLLGLPPLQLPPCSPLSSPHLLHHTMGHHYTEVNASHSLVEVSSKETISLEGIFNGLHLVGEELRLYSTESRSLRLIASFLHHIASFLNLPRYIDYYEMDHPFLMSSSLSSSSSSSSPSLRGDERMEVVGGDGEEEEDNKSLSPPNIMNHLCLLLAGKEPGPFPVLSPKVCIRTLIIIKLYALYSKTSSGEDISLFTPTLSERFGSKWKNLLEKSSSSHDRVVLAMVAKGMTRDDLASLPVGVALPLWNSIFHCREHPPPSSATPLYDIIGRLDMIETLNTTSADSLIIESLDNGDGMNMKDEILRLTFSKDMRINEVKRLLDSSTPVQICLDQKPEVSDHEFIENQERLLLDICQRTLALPIGRGMFTLGCSKPLPTSPLVMPTIELTGRAQPKNSTVSLEHVDKPANMTLWAEFHNGVGAGLRIAPSVKLESMWILSNRPKTPPSSSSSNHNNPNSEDTPASSSPQHAGLLLALGLTGHLSSSLMEYELFEYLQDKHELTTLAILLGIAAARVGSMQQSIASILSIFLPPLLPFGSADMDISHFMQTAALSAMGLLYLGSGNRHLTEVMLREIGHVPGPEAEFSVDRESYALSAGIALGMITLGRGGDLPGMADLRLVERLSLFILGGLKKEMLTGANPLYPSNLILEPEMVNIHVTSPAATIALGLMYLKTNDHAVASRLDVPTTLYELEGVRPDFFILRMASKGIVLWDCVMATEDWINSHIPQIVLKHAAVEKGETSEASETLSQAMLCITAGCCLALGLRYAGTLDQQAHSVLMKNLKILMNKKKPSKLAEEAGKSCVDMCVNVILLSVAMVMSGSGDLDVMRVTRILHARVGQSDIGDGYGSHMASHMALGFLFLGGCRYSLSRSNKAIACLYTSVYPLFPASFSDNRYHLQALRHLYVLAAEPRVLVTRDVESGRACSVEVCVRAENERISRRTPCIVPEWSSIKEIKVCSTDFWSVELDLSGEENKMRQVLSKTGTVFVHRKTGGGSRRGGRGETLTPWHLEKFYKICSIKGKLDLFGEGGGGETFLKGCPYKPLLAPEDSQDSNWQRFVTAALLECVSEEKLPVFPSFLHLDQVSHNVLSSVSSSTSRLWQLRLEQSLGVSNSHGIYKPASSSSSIPKSLIGPDVEMLHAVRARSSLLEFSEKIGKERSEKILRAYFLGGGGGEEEVEEENLDMNENEKEWLAANVIIYGVPPRRALGLTRQTTFEELVIKLQSLKAPPTAILPLLPVMKTKLPPSLFNPSFL